ncbi:glycosyltransferase family 4 protein [Sphingosinithalassobacter sp. LHW66-3]|uniref:glycosyltransferase family 4 protein n=1 Tax=Sphingosinithalassobacter sp. LHW66-3 TaxID=3424718 RepID=UPI003D6BADDA
MKASDLRVALFSGNYNYVRDGANQALNRLAEYLLRKGVTLRVYSPTTATPAFEPTGELVSVPAVPLPGGRDEYRLALGLPGSIRKDLRAYRPNIVHIAAPEILGHRAVSWARRNGIASVASVHTRFETYAQYYRLGFLEPLMIYLQTRLYNRVDGVVTPAPMMSDLLRGWGVETPIREWARGVNHDQFAPARRSLEWRRSLGIGDGELVIGFLSRLVLEKGLDVFAETIGELERRGVPHRVLIIGKGPAHDWVAERVPNAIFTGFLTGEDLGRAVASMDVFLFPSVTETFGNVTLEAMAAGVPVVAANATGAGSLVEEGASGYLIEPRAIADYADAIERLAADPALRARMGAAGHQRAQAYHWDRVNQEVVDMYLDVLARRDAR